MNALLTAKPSNLLPDLAPITCRIAEEHQHCIHAPKTALIHACNAGVRLLEIRSQLSPQQWQQWLTTDCPLPTETVKIYMTMASKWSYIPENLHRPSASLLPAEETPPIPASDPPIEAVIDVDFIPTTPSLDQPEKVDLIRFCLSGGVVPKARPRVTGNGTYLPQRYRTWRNKAEIELYRQMCDVYGHQQFPLEKAAISLRFFGKHRTNSDLDNMAGACLDALTLNGAGVLKDDCLRCLPQLTVEYVPGAPETGVWIEIEPLP